MRHLLVQQEEYAWGRPDQGEQTPPPSNHCDIRDEPIEDPGYTYCANHHKRRPVRDPIPVGPTLAAEYVGGFAYERVPLKPSPDAEEIRRHLLDLLDKFEETEAGDAYPSHPRVMDIVIWQLGEFREHRAVEPLRRMEMDVEECRADFIRETIDGIQRDAGSGE